MTASDSHVDAFAEIFGDPPADYAVPVDWAAVESWLGTSLPADYKASTTAYGPLDIGARLWLQATVTWKGVVVLLDLPAEPHSSPPGMPRTPSPAHPCPSPPTGPPHR
ncbi:hypothetical protein GTW46_36410 [Streptomyces sp. SID6013]|nr:hypothetical protein [Streptomyces sp. SID6013]